MNTIPTKQELEEITWEEATLLYPGVTPLSPKLVKIIGIDPLGRLVVIFEVYGAWYWATKRVHGTWRWDSEWKPCCVG